MNKNDLYTRLESAINDVVEKRKDLYAFADQTIVAKQELESAKNSVILSGKIDGKNAEIREAQMAEHVAKHIQYVQVSEAAERKARHLYEQAVTNLEGVRYLVRIAELAEMD